MKNTRKLFCLLFLGLTIFGINPAFAKGGFSYHQRGYFFGNATMPLEAAYTEGEQLPKDKLVPTSTEARENKITIENLKNGEAERTNIFHIIEWGDAGVKAACEDGHIRKVHFVEIKKQKISIPFLPFIPIYIDKYITVVYGE
ncbi:MAG: TRL domain-containing protein [bacterium]